MGDLEQRLKELGFLDVTGFEEGNFRYRIPIVNPTRRLTANYNNGTTLVVDNDGHSWIIPSKILKGGSISSLPMAADAYVPFSNDGGKFLKSVWPWAYPEE